MTKKKHRHHTGRLDSLTACISTTMVLILIGIIVFFGLMADSLSKSVKENFTVEVLLEDSISAADAKQMQKELAAMPYAKHVSYISKEKATKSMAEAFDTDPEEFVGQSPFPASFEINLVAEYTDKDSLERFMPSLKKVVGVTDVIYPEDLMTQVNKNIRQINIVLLVIAGLLAIISIALINNTIRLNVARRRHSIQTMKLVGASWGFIRKPFLKKSLWMGLIAALLACGTIIGGISTLTTWDTELAKLISPLVIAATCGIIIIVGLFLTLISAFFSVNKHLGMSRDEASLY